MRSHAKILGPASCLLVCLSFVHFTGGVFAQTGNASLTGTVHDSSGAVIPGAVVSLLNTDTGVAKKTVTTSGGLYVLTNLIPGTYMLHTEAAGLTSKDTVGIQLLVDQNARIDVEMSVATAQQEVTVSGSQQTLQTEDSSVGTVVDSHAVSNLPLNGRYFTQLLQIVPGAVSSENTARYNNADPQLAGRQRNGMPVFDVNGQSGGYTNYRLDGMDNRERQFGGANIPMSVDAIESFKLQTSNFSAEYGQASAQVDVVTKSGTNRVHGTVFEFLRNTALDATQWTYIGAHLPRNLRRNQFGTSVGGPIRKDHVFFFLSYEGVRQIFSSPQLRTVPSNAMRQGVFPSGVVITDPLSQAPFPNNTIPAARWNPISQKLLNVLPAPNLPGQAVRNNAGFENDPINNYNFNPTRRQTIDQYNARVDYNVSQKDNVMVRYTDSSNLLVGEGPLATNIQASIVGSERANLGGRNLSTGWYHNFGPRLFNEARFGFSSDPQNYQKGDATDYAAQVGLKQFLYPDAFPGLPDIKLGSIVLGSGDFRPLQVSEHVYDFTDNLTLVRSSHTVKLGGDLRWTHLLTANGNISNGIFRFTGVQTRDRSSPTTASTFCPGVPTARNCNAGDAMADFLLGYPSQSTLGSPERPIGKNFGNWAGYVNDTWHVRGNLTITVGLRYEYIARFHANPSFYSLPILKNGDFTGVVAVANDSSGKMSSLVLPEAAAQVAGAVVTCRSVGLPDKCLVNQGNLWQPRVGFAWHLERKTVIRGGAGMFYGGMAGDQDTEEGLGWPFINNISTPNFTSAPASNAPPPISFSNPFQGPSPAVPTFGNSADPNRKVPSTYEWNLTLERALDASTVAAVSTSAT
jgi:hypothetical protein